MKSDYRHLQTQKGFMKVVILTILALVLLNVVFGFDAVEFLTIERLTRFWNEDVVGPAKNVWDKLFVEIIWEKFLAKFFS